MLTNYLNEYAAPYTISRPSFTEAYIKDSKSILTVLGIGQRIIPTPKIISKTDLLLEVEQTRSENHQLINYPVNDGTRETLLMKATIQFNDNKRIAEENSLYCKENPFVMIPKRKTKDYPEKILANKNKIIMFHYEMLCNLAKKYISLYGLGGRIEFTDLVHEGVLYMANDRNFNSAVVRIITGKPPVLPFHID